MESFLENLKWLVDNKDMDLAREMAVIIQKTFRGKATEQTVADILKTKQKVARTTSGGNTKYRVWDGKPIEKKRDRNLPDAVVDEKKKTKKVPAEKAPKANKIEDKVFDDGKLKTLSKMTDLEMQDAFETLPKLKAFAKGNGIDVRNNMNLEQVAKLIREKLDAKTNSQEEE